MAASANSVFSIPQGKIAKENIIEYSIDIVNSLNIVRYKYEHIR